MNKAEGMLVEELIFSLSRAIRGIDHEGTGAIVEMVAQIGFIDLQPDVREELLALAEYCGWTDGPEYFKGLHDGNDPVRNH